MSDLPIANIRGRALFACKLNEAVEHKIVGNHRYYTQMHRCVYANSTRFKCSFCLTNSSGSGVVGALWYFDERREQLEYRVGTVHCGSCNNAGWRIELWLSRMAQVLLDAEPLKELAQQQRLHAVPSRGAKVWTVVGWNPPLRGPRNVTPAVLNSFSCTPGVSEDYQEPYLEPSEASPSIDFIGEADVHMSYAGNVVFPAEFFSDLYLGAMNPREKRGYML